MLAFRLLVVAFVFRVLGWGGLVIGWLGCGWLHARFGLVLSFAD